jgi:hypothetical protein
VPLRSVEAATRDDAIAAAREQFGPGARVIGVRRVRSGGVLGFFATERYVAEVDPDHPSRTAGRERAAARSSAMQAAEAATAARRAEPAATQATPRAAADRVSELAGLLGHDAGPSADTALPTYSRATVARPSAAREFLAHDPAHHDAPQRGARPEPTGWEPTGWEPTGWEPARTGSTRWEPARWEPTRAEPARPDAEPARPAAEAFDWARFEAARAGTHSEPAPGSLRIRAGVAEPAPAPWSVAAAVLDGEKGAVRDGRDDDAPSTGASPSPSPFTAALARMVAGDRDVRKAVQAALDDRAARDDRVAARPGRDDAEPPRPRSTTPVATPAKTGAGHQEEEPVEQDDVSTSLRTEVRPAEFPTWAEPEPVAEPVSRREEAIAEVLRAALAQGHSDEALTAILRKVLDGASPQAALTAEAAAPAIDAQPLAAEIAEVSATRVPLADIPLGDLPLPVAALDEAPVLAAPDPVQALVAETYAPSVGYAAVDVHEPAGSGTTARAPATGSAPSWLGSGLPLWGEPLVGAQLWGGTTASSRYTDVRADEPIWAEVVLHEPGSVAQETAIVAPAIEEPVAEEPAAEEPAALEPAALEPAALEPAALEPAASEPVAEAPAVEAPGADAPVTDDATAESPVVETPVFESGPVAEAPVLDTTLGEPTVAEAPAAEPAAAEAPPVEEFRAAAEPLTATLARTASDPAPMPLDATAVMPPLSLLPPLPSSGRRSAGLPPVPPMPSRSLLSPSRPTVSRPAAEARTEPEPAPAPAPMKTLATVTRLPVAPLADVIDDVFDDVNDDVFEYPAVMAEEEPTMVESQVAEVAEVAVSAPVVSEPAAPPAPVAPRDAEPAPVIGAATVAAPAVPVRVPTPAPTQPSGLAGRLRSLGIPEWLLGPSFAADAALYGTYAALTRALGTGLPAAPVVPDGAGEVLFVVGPGVETLRAARSLAAWLRLDPDRVQWASRGDLAGLAPEYSRVTTIETAIERRQDATHAGTVTIVAVDAPLRTDVYWISQMLAIWAPEAVWAVVDATRKPEDVEPWIDGLPRVDALMVEDTDLSVDPAAVLHRIAMPVALLDGVPATPHRWASLLCERLEKQQG